jgi:phage terminase large subunit-like protein
MPFSTASISRYELRMIRKGRRSEDDACQAAIEARTDFIKFRKYVCNHETPPHHQGWMNVLNTGQDSKCLHNIGGPHTLILAPRGAAKSSFLVEWAAYQLGQHLQPSVRTPLKIMYVSYSIEVSLLKSEQIQSILMDSKYQEVFPWVRPGAKWGSRLWDIDKEAAGLVVTGAEPYTLACAGLKGVVVSKRCLTGDTMVETELGRIPISQLHEHLGLKILTFNEQNGEPEWCRLRETAKRFETEIFRVRTNSGVEVCCTSNHPFYIPGQGYRNAGDLVPGDTVVRITGNQGNQEQLPGVPKNLTQKKFWKNLLGLLLCGQKGRGGLAMWWLQAAIHLTLKYIQGQVFGGQNLLLQPQMPRKGSGKAQTLSRLQCSDFYQDKEWWWGAFLSGLQKKTKTTQEIAAKKLSSVWRSFPALYESKDVLLSDLCGYSSFREDDRRGKQPFQGWNQLFQRIPGFKTINSGSGWRVLHCLWQGRSSNEVQELRQRRIQQVSPCYSPFGSQSAEQRPRQSGNNVCGMSWQASPDNAAWQTDTISSVERLGTQKQPTDVYDIEVEGNHNFFANGLLVHNSHLVLLDDLLKSPDQIENPIIREKMEGNWTNAIRPTMYEGARAVCLGTRMGSEDIYATAFTEERGWSVIEESAIIEEGNEEVSYWPEMHSIVHLQGLRDDDPSSFALQYQNTIPKDSLGVIDPEWWIEGPCPLIEEMESVVIGSDFSASKREGSDYTVFCLIGRKDGKYYLLDMRRGRWQGNIDKCNALVGLLLDWGFIETDTSYYTSNDGVVAFDLSQGPVKIQQNDLYVTLFAEGQSYQVSFQSDYAGYIQNELGIWNVSVIPVAPKGDKMQRLKGVTGIFQRKQVVVNKYCPTFKVLRRELLNFGFTKRDDTVDAMVYGLAGLGIRPNVDVA